MAVQKLINSAVQIVLFTLIPFIWWLITARKETGFFKWIGLKGIKSAKENKTLFWVIGILICFTGLSAYMLYSMRGIEMATSEFSGLGAAAIPAVLIYAILNTSLPEEIVFRGFLLKRISAKFGFHAGNIVQAVIFGIMHGVMFFSYTGVVKAIVITLFTGVIGWLMGFVNEKKAEGSLIPSWCIHAVANIFSGLCAAFMIF
ncbi:MAG: CPBP family intramembrane metalloprotease [Lachnospiraceae bacterium]|nr:CPBP family intramembrane metalloprotease [Lachnospiraceae bacterium]